MLAKAKVSIEVSGGRSSRLKYNEGDVVEILQYDPTAAFWMARHGDSTGVVEAKNFDIIDASPSAGLPSPTTNHQFVYDFAGSPREHSGTISMSNASDGPPRSPKPLPPIPSDSPRRQLPPNPKEVSAGHTTGIPSAPNRRLPRSPSSAAAAASAAGNAEAKVIEVPSPSAVVDDVKFDKAIVITPPLSPGPHAPITPVPLPETTVRNRSPSGGNGDQASERNRSPSGGHGDQASMTTPTDTTARNRSPSGGKYSRKKSKDVEMEDNDVEISITASISSQHSHHRENTDVVAELRSVESKRSKPRHSEIESESDDEFAHLGVQLVGDRNSITVDDIRKNPKGVVAEIKSRASIAEESEDENPHPNPSHRDSSGLDSSNPIKAFGNWRPSILKKHLGTGPPPRLANPDEVPDAQELKPTTSESARRRPLRRSDRDGKDENDDEENEDNKQAKPRTAIVSGQSNPMPPSHHRHKSGTPKNATAIEPSNEDFEATSHSSSRHRRHKSGTSRELSAEHPRPRVAKKSNAGPDDDDDAVSIAPSLASSKMSSASSKHGPTDEDSIRKAKPRKDDVMRRFAKRHDVESDND